LNFTELSFFIWPNLFGIAILQALDTEIDGSLFCLMKALTPLLVTEPELFLLAILSLFPPKPAYFFL
jgi:hypothetical protein